MIQSSMLIQYEKLPENYKEEVMNFISYLQFKANGNNTFDSSDITLKRNVFGSLKGKIKMSDDFDAPLEEFEDYL